LRIWATDIDETRTFGRIIAQGIYSDQDTKRIPPAIRARYFSPYGSDGSLQLHEEIRRAVRFQQHDLLSLEPIREQFGLIVCKNVLLHFSARQRVEVIRMFHRALSDSGYFVTEQTQTLPVEVAHLFTRVSGSGQLFKKKVPPNHEMRTREDRPHDARRELAFHVMRREDHGSAYDWMNIDCGPTRVGKVRGLVDGQRLVIHSMNIFPEYEQLGYGQQTVEMLQTAFDTIVADRVRHTATGFWRKMGFAPDPEGQFVWRRTAHGARQRSCPEPARA
jgi:hypothetical protein